MAGELDLDRLVALEQLLGQSVAEIVETLVGELAAALESVGAALDAENLPEAALAAHAARNSALMIEARPMLARLDVLEACARREDLPGAAQAHRTLLGDWPPLRAELRRAAVVSAPCH
jgi:hypothetical protein